MAVDGILNAHLTTTDQEIISGLGLHDSLKNSEHELIG